MEHYASVDTEILMGIANEMAGYTKTPADSAIYYPGHSIRRLLTGVDVSAAELLFARNYGFDAVLSHNPIGLVDGWRCFHEHQAQLIRAGVPHGVAQAAVAPTLEALALRAQSENFDRLSSLAKLLDMPLLNIHQALDELGRRILQATIDRVLATNSTATLRQIADALDALPEFQAAPTSVHIVLGDPEAPAGRTIMAHGAYTNGGYDVAAAYFAHGVDTVAYTELDPGDLSRLRADGRGQLLVTGRIASDAVGINPYIARLESMGIEVVRISGAIG